ncbi:MAG: TolC family protein [Symploca sp. SIO2E9]|nr:TolC family protein [Symploca sp. SIO2E9]
MSTSRHFVVLGLGAGIALSLIKPSASQDLPLLTKPKSDFSASENVNSVVVNTSKPLSPSPATSPSTGSSVELGDKPTLTIGKPEVIPVIASSSKQPKKSGLLVEEKLTHSAVKPSTAATTSAELEQLISQSPESERPDSVPTLESPQPESPESTPEETQAPKPESPESTPRETQAPESETPESTPGETQAPKPESQQSPPAGIELPASDTQSSSLEFLNPSPNPLLFPTQAEEVEVKTTQAITLTEAIALARRNSPTLQQARLTLQRNEFALREALAAEFPTAVVQTDLTHTDSAAEELTNEARAEAGVLEQDTASTQFNATLQLSYNLYTGGLRPAQIRAAEEQVRLQQLQVETVAEQLRLDVTEAYYNLQNADAQVEIFEAAVEASEQNLRDAQLLEQAGLGTRFDVLQQEVQLADDQQSLISSGSNQDIAISQLVGLLNLGQQVEVTAADPIESAGEWKISLEESIVLALKNRAELEQPLVQRIINEQQRRIALAAIRPQVTLSAAYNALNVFDDDFGFGDGVTLQATMQWNFFDGGAARARAKQEEVDIATAESQFEDIRGQIRLQVETAYYELEANQENIGTTTVAVEQAQESLRLARLRFQAGVGTQTEVINQQTALTRARSNLLNATVEYNRSLAQLQRAISNLPDSNLSDIP